MKIKLSSVLVLVLTTATFLPGCTDTQTRAQIDKDIQTARTGLEEAKRPSIPNKHYNPLVVTDKVWTGSTSLHMQRGVPLPEKFEGPHGIAIVSSEPMAIPDIMQEIQRQTGITLHVPETILRPIGSARAGGAATAGVAGAATTAPAGANGGPGSMSANEMLLAYEGPLSGLLERVTGYFGLNWRYDGSIISVTGMATKVFVVEALPGTQSVKDGMQDDSSSGGGSSSGTSGSSGGSSQSSVTQNSKFTIDIKYWEELEKVITAMLNGFGNVVVSPSLGTVTVTTIPRIMTLVADYLAEENARISRQIAINVEIYTVSLNRGINFNVAFNTVLRRIGNFSGNFAGASGPASIASGFNGGGALSLAILNPHDHVGEVTDVFTAISGIGDTTKVAQFPLITLNNRPVSRRVGQDVSYVASATSNTSGSGSSSTFSGTTLTPGTVHQGFSVQMTPRLLDDGRILLQYSLSIIDLLGIKEFNSVTGSTASTTTTAPGSSTIQIPTTANRIFVQQSVLKSGSTLILGGAEEDDAQLNSQGVGDPYNYALGGGINSDAAHTMVFFAITPQVLDTPHSEQD